MSTFGWRMMVLGVAAVTAGCASAGSVMIQKENCLPGIGPKEAVVVIYLDPVSKKPAASPDECHVPQGGSVTFATPDDATKGFEIAFDKGNGTPSADNDGDFVSRKQGAKGYVAVIERVKEHKKDGKNTYNYTIDIGGVKTDPSIIIDM